MDKREVTRGVIAGLVATVAIACSSMAEDIAHDMAEDAGSAMAGAGAKLQDAGAKALRDAGMKALADAAVDAGTALEDAGRAVRDAGRGQRDSGVRDARAQEAAEPIRLTAKCNVKSGQRTTTATTVTENIAYYAEFDVTEYSREDLARATSIACDLKGTYYPNDCATNATCEDIGRGLYAAPDCAQGSFEVFGTTLRVYCGRRFAAGDVVSSDWHWDRVDLIVPR
jgi:hypothetical protein